jgi:cyclopropane fatty-acyl-phospholipid synthase-like methyltransferase
MTKPFSKASEKNKHAILDVLQGVFKHSSKVLEIGSGTGQHAIFFADQLPHLEWQTSDRAENHAGMMHWLEEAQLENVKVPLTLDVGVDPIACAQFDAIYTANTAHIMQADEVKLMFTKVINALPSQGLFCQYGPFTQGGIFSSESNQAFHLDLVKQGYGGYRDIDELTDWVGEAMVLETIHPMPANNLLLQWRKR